MFCYFHPFLWLFAFPKHLLYIYNLASSVYIKLLLYISSFFCTYQTSSIHIKLLLYIIRCKVRSEPPHALKGQKLLAQGIALGITAVSKTPCKGKSFQTQGIKTAMGFRYPYRNPIVILV